MRKRNILTLIILVFFSLYIRFGLITNGPFHGDCLNMALKAEMSLADHQVHLIHGHGYPGSMVVSIAAIALARVLGCTDPVLPLNIMSIIFSSLSVALVILIGTKLFDSTTGLLGSFMLSISPIFLANSTYGNSHMPFIFFFLLSILFILFYHQEHRRRFLVYAALCFGCAGAMRVQDILTTLPAITYLLWVTIPLPSQEKDNIKTLTPRKKTINYVLFIIIVLATLVIFYLPLFTSLAENATHRSIVKNLYSNRITGINWHIIKFSTKKFILNFTYIGLLFILSGFYSLFKNTRRIFWLFIIWGVIPLFIYGNWDTFAARFFIPTLIPLCLCIGYAMSNFLKYSLPIKISVALCYLITVTIQFFSILPLAQFHHKYSVNTDLAHWTAQHTEPNATIITKENHRFISYYGNRAIFYRPSTRDTITDKQLQSFNNKLKRTLAAGKPAYITRSGIFSNDRYNKFSDFLQDNYQLTPVGCHPAESWQRGATHLRIYREVLFRINQKK